MTTGGPPHADETYDYLPARLRDAWSALRAETSEGTIGLTYVTACEQLVQLVGRLPLAICLGGGHDSGGLQRTLFEQEGRLLAGRWLRWGLAATGTLVACRATGDLIAADWQTYFDRYGRLLDQLVEFRNRAAHGIARAQAVRVHAVLMRPCLDGLRFVEDYQFRAAGDDLAATRVGVAGKIPIDGRLVSVDAGGALGAGRDGDETLEGSTADLWDAKKGRDERLKERRALYRERRGGTFRFATRPGQTPPDEAVASGHRSSALRSEDHLVPPALAALEPAEAGDVVLVEAPRGCGRSSAVANADRLPAAQGRTVLTFYCEDDGPTCSATTFLRWLLSELRDGEVEAGGAQAKAPGRLDYDAALQEVRDALAAAGQRGERYLVAVDDVDRAVPNPYGDEGAAPGERRSRTIPEAALALRGPAVTFLLTGALGCRRAVKHVTRVTLAPADNPTFAEFSEDADYNALLRKELGGDTEPLRVEILGVLSFLGDGGAGEGGGGLTCREIAAALARPTYLVRHHVQRLRPILTANESDEDRFTLYARVLEQLIQITPKQRRSWEANLAAYHSDLARRPRVGGESHA